MAAIGRKTDTWGSRFGFIMAAVGSSVGLGNFWRFPFTAGENGGGAFIVIYIACVILFGLPVLMAEYGMGRKSGMSAIEGIHSLARTEKKSQNWGFVGWVGSLAAFFILTFYMVISAWVIAFIPQAFSGTFNGFTAETSGANFGATIGNRGMILACLGGFIAVNVIILARGVKGGIERAASILMPLFFVLLLGIVGFALTNGDAGKAAAFLLQPDFSKVTFSTFLAAVGQAFFSIGVGSCLMITYGAYLSQDNQYSALFRHRSERGYDGGFDRRFRDLPNRVRLWCRPCGRSEPVLRLLANRVWLRGDANGPSDRWCLLHPGIVRRFDIVDFAHGSRRVLVGRTTRRCIAGARRWALGSCCS